MTFLKTSLVLALLQTLSFSLASSDVDSPLLRTNKLPRLLAFDAADSTETYYSEDAQAWRMLGLYMDCAKQDDGTSLCERFLLWAAVSVWTVCR